MTRAAAIFDMDGVLTDSHALHEEAWQRLCKEEGLKLGDRAIWRLTSGRRTHDALPLVFERSLSPEDLVRLTARRFALYRELAATAFPVTGVAQFLADLSTRGVPCALATSAPPDLVAETLGRLSLNDVFAIRVTGSDVIHGKPDPEVYLKAAERLGVPPSACVAFDDAVIGIQAARRAGMAAVGVATAHGHEELLAVGAALVVRDFAGLTWSELAVL